MIVKEEWAEEIGKRLADARKLVAPGMSQLAFAKECHVASASLKNFERGHTLISTGLIIILYQQYQISPQWLLLGEGHPRQKARTAELIEDAVQAMQDASDRLAVEIPRNKVAPVVRAIVELGLQLDGTVDERKVDSIVRIALQGRRKGTMMVGNQPQLRNEHGGLIGGLVVEDYNRGFEDFEAGAPWPDFSSASYDLGRQRAAERKAEKAADDQQVRDWIKREQDSTRERLRSILSPDAFADYERQIARLR